MASPLPSVVCCRRGAPVLCSVDVPDQYSALVVERTVCPHACAECADLPAVAVVGGVDGDGVAEALTDFGGCVEVSFGKLLCGDNLAPTLERHGLYMALSTTTAYGVEPARLFCAALASRLGLSDALRESMELAVHEAVVNGLMHGNLEITSADRQTLEGFANYCRTVELRLADPEMGTRRIEVFANWDDKAVEISVVDSGEGYDLDALTASDDPNRKSGRGLVLIRTIAQAVSIEDHGRRLTMKFSR